jgi:hypothetical protein
MVGLDQHPRQMLVTPWLSSRSFSLTAARSAPRRTCDDANRVRRCFIARTRPEPWRSKGRVELSGATVVGVAGLIADCGSAGILAALPMPLGSLIEPLRPFTFPGPGGMPLTPASWANEALPIIVVSTAANNRLLRRVPTETDLIWASAIFD